ncbi:MAG: cbb3-type cytochrome c oxidase subunit I [Methylacidiphilales bacterium]|nr:cbb3-type cytochrome c oxidase subunit I [Candidatus Methylacidiphilales bacterium]MDW8349690.1 cbb3-type cytochrome c oxidase subunit I [Verrucomicrobiae bacterium]
MNTTPNTPLDPTTAQRIAIDQSVRLPILFFFASAIFWLIIGTLFGLISSIVMHSPEFHRTNIAWLDALLTFGRIRPAHVNAVAYGWASMAGIGVAIWLMARLCRVPLEGQRLIISAGILWNIGVTLGIIGILIGDGYAIEWLEFPTYATFTLFTAFAIIAIWAVRLFIRRDKNQHIYVSQWYLLAALFWFPWLYGTAQILLILTPVAGVTQGAVNWWYGHNALGLWFTPIGLAAAYYFIPKVIGRPVHSYYLSVVGFWTLAFFYSWNGMHHLIGGPYPVWLISVSTVASVMMVIPVVTVAINHHMTMRGHFHLLRYSPTLRFVVFGAMAYTLVSLQGSSMSIRSLNVITHFTHYTVGHAHLGLYAFYTMIMFGSIYYIVPRLLRWEWPSATLIRIHFWCTAIGISVMFLILSVGGLIQGLALNDPNISFMATVDLTIPFLWIRSLSGIMILIGHIAFAIQFVLMLLRFGKPKSGPTYFHPIPEPVTSTSQS